MTQTFTPPSQLCILRLSALGDTCHLVPIVRTLQQAWPATRLSWVIGRMEAKLLHLLPELEFITIAKSSPWRARRELAATLAGRRFDVLLHMQLSLRASLLSTAIPATRRIGFDRARARELQWLFTNERIEARQNEHVLDSFFGFVRALGIADRVPAWTLPIPDAERLWAEQKLPGGQPTLVISPCSSHRHRNWPAARYAELARYAQQRHGMRVVLCGGRSDLEREYGTQIEHQSGVPVLNLIGQDTLPQLLALLARATVLLSPDSGPAHMATLVGTPVIGLYAATRLARSGPYLSRQWCVDRYELAARRFRNKSAAQLPWAEKIEAAGVMELIETEAVCARLDELLHR